MQHKQNCVPPRHYRQATAALIVDSRAGGKRVRVFSGHVGRVLLEINAAEKAAHIWCAPTHGGAVEFVRRRTESRPSWLFSDCDASGLTSWVFLTDSGGVEFFVVKPDLASFILSQQSQQ